MVRMAAAAAVIVALTTCLSPSLAQLATDVVDLASFADQVLDPGTETEDWQPAFQAAIAEARETQRPIYVPTGEYKIRRAIEILPVEVEGKPFRRNNIRMFGAGQHKSVISQQVETENCINWTGLEYEKSAVHGHLSNLCLGGGKITLNIKWHNYFTLESCYVVGAAQHGVYTEGWSSRFLNSTIRWCKEAGFVGGAHFNNCVLRDCYFSRDGIGVLLSGVHGSRLESCGLESCAKAAIFVRHTRGLTVSNCYFEGNGYKNVDVLPVEGTANTVHLDLNCWAITIHDCIFRVNLDEEGALISVADCRHGHIYDNYFYCANPARNGIKLRGRSETKPEAETAIKDLIVEHNAWHNLENPLSEAEPGLYEKALKAGCSFDWPLSRPTE
jgi:hypothetical protein